MAKDTGLEIDEELEVDLGMSKDRESNSAAEEKKIEEAVKRARIELKSLLNEPIVEPGSRGMGYNTSQRRDKFVVYNANTSL